MDFYQVCISCDDQHYCGTSLALESLVLYHVYIFFFYHGSDVPLGNPRWQSTCVETCQN